MKLIGILIVGSLVAMAAIPLLMGAVIFAPIYIPVAILCVCLEDSGKH